MVVSVGTAYDLTCTYCGVLANSRDHLFPCAYRGYRTFTSEAGEIVAACAECNSLLGDQLLFKIKDRAAFLHTAYSKRWGKLLRTPRWTMEELAELDGSLRESITRTLYDVDVCKLRLAYLLKMSQQTR